jgi:hypothetical protein
MIIPTCPDGVLYATDDIEFLPMSIENAFAASNKLFPEDNGCIGFYQIDCSDNWHPTGVALLGKRFVDQYPGRKPFYSGYWHFAAQEILWLAEKKNTFFSCPEAQIRHYHPANRALRCLLNAKDTTHEEARKHSTKDHMLQAARKKAGQIWGDKGD